MSIESVMPSNHLILYRPLLLLPSVFHSIRVFSNESALRIRWPKYWSSSFKISPSNEHPGLISWNPLIKDTPRPKTKKKPPLDSRKSTILIKSKPIPARWMIHKLENKTIIPKKFPLCCEGSEPHISFLADGSNKGTGNPQEIWPQRPMGFDYKTSTGWGQTDSLESTNKILHTPGPRGKRAMAPQETKPRLPACVGGSPMEAQVSRVRGTGSSCPPLA